MFFSHPFHNLGKHVWLPTLCYMRASRSCAWLMVKLCIPTKDTSRTCLKPTRIVTEQTVLLKTIKLTIGGWSHTTKWQKCGSIRTRIRCQASTFLSDIRVKQNLLQPAFQDVEPQPCFQFQNKLKNARFWWTPCPAPRSKLESSYSTPAQTPEPQLYWDP